MMDGIMLFVKNKIKFIIALIFLLQLGFVQAQQNQDYILAVTSFVANPNNFFPFNETQIVVTDPMSEFPLYIIDVEKDEIIHRARSGRGPGELGQMYKTITFPDENVIAVYDRQLMRLLLFDLSLNFIEQVELNNISGNFMHVGFTSVEHLFIVPSENNLVELYSYAKSDEENGSELVFNLKHDDSIYTEELDNFLLKQNIYFFNDSSENELYIVFRYSSILLKVDESGITFINTEPENYNFPIVEPRGGRIYALPELDIYPIGALDITGCERHIYVLYSGNKMGSGLLSRFRGPDAIIEKITHSDIVHVYDRHSGEYIDSIQLPKTANKFKIYGDYIYLYRTIDEEFPVLYKYDKSVLAHP